jgi:hypothetical protein
MNLTIAILALLLAQQNPPKISPAAPLVEQGGTLRFSADEDVTWEVRGGGTIDPDGSYHAPVRLVAPQSLGGLQIGPINSIFHTRIDTLPLHPKSAAWLKSMNAPRTRLTVGPALCKVNLVRGGQPTIPMKFAYTPEVNRPWPMPAYPYLFMESGYWVGLLPDGRTNSYDRHIAILDRDRELAYEIYNWHQEPVHRGKPLLETAQGGQTYDLLGYDLPFGGVNAGGLPILPLVFSDEEVARGEINHPVQMATGKPGMTEVLWPARSTANTSKDPDAPPMGMWLRLKSSVTLADFSPEAQIFLRCFQRYGVINVDTGYNGEIDGSEGEYSPAVRKAMVEIIQSRLNYSDFEAVDVSSLKVANTSLQTPVNETVVTARSRKTGLVARASVRLRAVTIGVPRLNEAIQAGTTMALEAFVSGTPNRKLTWSMEPRMEGATLDAESGRFEAPRTLAAPARTRITATSAADPAKSATLAMTVLPSGEIRINAGSAETVTDSKGRSWWPDVGYLTGGFHHDPSGFAVPEHPDPALYQKAHTAVTDVYYRFGVPNGAYKVTVGMVEFAAQPGHRGFHLEAQGQIVHRYIDPFTRAGGRGRPLELELPATVTDGVLTVVLRHGAVETGESYGPLLSTLAIAPDPGTPRLTLDRTPPGPLAAGKKSNFYAAGWYLKNPAVTWSVSPPIGSIDEYGIYSAPAELPPGETIVMVKATSLANPTLSSTLPLTLSGKR